MCGIVAVHSPQGGLVGTELFEARAQLRPRGPDGEGMWLSPTGRAALGHTRLLTSDPEGGTQPIAGPGQETHLVVDGGFYGGRAIRRELRDTGSRFTTGGDGEIALHLYLRDGWQALDRLRGEFAFVLWDERRGSLFAARDRFGVKPLYYTWRAGRLWLASEIKALLACGAPASWDTASFAAHLQLGLPAGRTLFEDIRQLPPGHYLVADADGPRLCPYWEPDYPTAEEFGEARPRLDEHLLAVREQVEEAVRLRMATDVPLAFHLSGGLDSSSVVATAARYARVTAFTVSFDDPAFDETPQARRTAAQLGIDHREIASERGHFATHLRETVRAGEMVQENAHGTARYLHSARIKKDGYTVVLAGEGGDELFIGYPQFRKDLALGLDAGARERAAEGYAKTAGLGLPPYLRSLLGTLGFLPSWLLERYLHVVQPVATLLRPEFAAELAAVDAAAPLLHQGARQLAGRLPVHQSSYLFAKSWLPGYILAAERLDSSQALEVRLPFFDHRLFEVVRRTPPAWYDMDGAGKYPLRAAMRDRLPREVAEGAKRPFFAPPVVTDDDMLAVLRDLVESSAMRDNPFFSQRAVRALLERMSQASSTQRAANERLLQLVASTCVLGEVFGMTVSHRQLGGRRGA